MVSDSHDATSAALGRVKLKPSAWAAQTLWLSETERLSYDGRRFTPEMIDTRASEVVWVTSRQIGKTVNSLALHAAYMANIPGYGVIYVVPEQDQASKYSHDRVEPMFEHSPILSELHTGIDNVYEKSFGNGSRLYMKWAKHNVGSTRGISGHFLQVDEAQSVDLNAAMPVIKQIIFTAKEHRYTLISGTPLSHDNALTADYWAASDQREWMVRCRHHTPIKYLELGPRNIGKKGPICHHCGNLLNVDDGIWIAASPSDLTLPVWERKMPGFHIAQIHTKLSHSSEERWVQWCRELEKMDPDKALNEVWGRSSSTSENPITRELMERLCSGGESMMKVASSRDFRSNRYAGIDWGHGAAATTLLIGQHVDGVFKVLYMQQWTGTNTDADICVPEIVQVLKDWSVNRVHADWGGGHGLNKPLALAYGTDRVTTNYWSANAAEADGTWVTQNQVVPRLTLNKTRALSELLNMMRRHKVQFPDLPDCEPFIEFFTNVRQERDSDDNLVFVKKKNDDMFHSLAYAWVIACIGDTSDQDPMDT